MIFDRYTAQLRSMPRPPDSTDGDPLMRTHDEIVRVVASASAEMDRLSAIVERDRRGLARGVRG